jgi:hypothetical protein
MPSFEILFQVLFCTYHILRIDIILINSIMQVALCPVMYVANGSLMIEDHKLTMKLFFKEFLPILTSGAFLYNMDLPCAIMQKPQNRLRGWMRYPRHIGSQCQLVFNANGSPLLHVAAAAQW